VTDVYHNNTYLSQVFPVKTVNTEILVNQQSHKNHSTDSYPYTFIFSSSVSKGENQIKDIQEMSGMPS
jgi:hypothetical protein